MKSIFIYICLVQLIKISNTKKTDIGIIIHDYI